MKTRPLVGSCSPVMTLTVVVLPAPLGPIRPGIWPRRADRLTSETALMPTNFTDTSTISSAACGSVRTVVAVLSVAGADKVALLLEEDRGRGAGDGTGGGEGRLRSPPECLPQVVGALRDPSTD